jgi:hypothetical protein
VEAIEIYQFAKPLAHGGMIVKAEIPFPADIFQNDFKRL